MIEKYQMNNKTWLLFNYMDEIHSYPTKTAAQRGIIEHDMCDNTASIACYHTNGDIKWNCKECGKLFVICLCEELDK